MADVKEWTIMVYMAGDNNLSEDMITALKGMQSIANDKNVNLLALYESNYVSTPSTIYEFTFNSRKEPLAGCIIDSRLANNHDEVSSESDKIPKFVHWVTKQKNYEAKNYALILSGHGDGILGKTLFRSNNSPTTVLSLTKLKDILINAKTALGPGRKFSILGFDTCLMNMLEVGFELEEVADVMVASQGHVPTSGWAYEKVLEDLIDSEGKLDKRDFAVSIVEQFSRFHSEYSVGGRSVSISACDLGKAKKVAGAIEKLAQSLSEILSFNIDGLFSDEQATTNSLIKEKVKSILLNSRYYTQTFMHEQAVDILDFTQNLSFQCQKMQAEIQLIYGNLPKSSIPKCLIEKLELIQANCSEIESEVDRYIIANSISGADYQFSTGTSIFFPWTRLALNLVHRFYKELDFCKTFGKHWLNFIEQYTVSTLRIKEDELYGNDIHRLAISGHKEVGGRAETAKEVGGRAETAREYPAKENLEEFYTYFRRIRNYPINPKGYSRTK